MPQDYDSAYKAFYERLFQGWNVPVQTQVEVSRRAKSIDVVIWCEMHHLQRLTGTAFAHFRRINTLELKGPEDPLNRANYMLIVSRAYGLLAKQKAEADGLPQHATINIVCSVRPDTILDRLQSELHFVPTDEPGVYLCDQEIPRRIFVATELEVIPKNYPWLILAKGAKLLEFFERVVEEGLTEYVEVLFQVAVDIDPETLIEGVRKMASRHKEVTPGLRRALNAWFGEHPEEIHKTEVIQKVIEAEKRNASIRVGEEAMIQAKREDLSLLLESKFGQLSEALVSKLEALRDVDKLTGLYKRALLAQTLDEIGL